MILWQGIGRGVNSGVGQVGAAEMLDTVLLRTEASFLAAGDDLAACVDALQQLASLFDRLGVTFGAENGGKLVGLIAGTRGQMARIEDGFARVLGGNEQMRRAVRGVRVEVGDLDRVVRTIANVSINARIQGNGLIPPRPQVTAFIERLAVMAADAEAILADVREAMTGIGSEMAELDAVTQEVRDALAQRVVPALGRFDRMAQGLLDRQDKMAATNAGLAGRMAAINAEVSRLVVGLQAGDATRQRLERVRAILASVPVDGSDRPVRASVLLDLVAGLSGGAVAGAAEEIAMMVSAAKALQQSAEAAVAQARDCYIDRAGYAGPEGGAAGGFASGIAAVRARLGLMRDRAAALRERLAAILRHEAALRHIGHQVRLSGLNAVLICAKLGEEGRALRELAQWLRTLTDESDAIVVRLQTVLDDTAQLAERLTGEGIRGFDTALAAFFDEAAALGAVIAGIGADRAEAARMFDEVGQSLPLRLGHAVQALMRFQLLLHDMTLFDAAIAARRAEVGPGEAGPVDAGPAETGSVAEADAGEAAALAALRKRYTMQAERDIHDRVAGTDAPDDALAPVVKRQSVQAVDGDDLCDVLF